MKDRRKMKNKRDFDKKRFFFLTKPQCSLFLKYKDPMKSWQSCYS